MKPIIFRRRQRSSEVIGSGQRRKANLDPLVLVPAGHVKTLSARIITSAARDFSRSPTILCIRPR